MSALCHAIPYLYYSALISLYLSLPLKFLCLALFYSFSLSLLISKCVYMSFYIIRIASLQCNHGYFLYVVVNKNNTQVKTKLENITIIFYSIMYYCPFLHYTTIITSVLSTILSSKILIWSHIASKISSPMILFIPWSTFSLSY